jgi:hypothetical protein
MQFNPRCWWLLRDAAKGRASGKSFGGGGGGGRNFLRVSLKALSGKNKAAPGAYNGQHDAALYGAGAVLGGHQDGAVMQQRLISEGSVPSAGVYLNSSMLI